MRTRTFWAIGLSGMMIYYSILALYNHLFLYLRGLGFEPLKAGFALSLLGLLGLTGKLINGALADRIDRHKVFLACQAIMLVGVALLASQRANLVLVAIAVIGLGWGGLFTLYNMLAVSNFGLRSAGKIGGVISLMESLGGGLGIWLTGVLYDRSDSYQQAFLLILGLVFAGLLLGTQIRSEVREAGDSLLARRVSPARMPCPLLHPDDLLAHVEAVVEPHQRTRHLLESLEHVFQRTHAPLGDPLRHLPLGARKVRGKVVDEEAAHGRALRTDPVPVAQAMQVFGSLEVLGDPAARHDPAVAIQRTRARGRESRRPRCRRTRPRRRGRARGYARARRRCGS